MTAVLARYVARLLLARLAVILTGLAGLLILLDFLADGDQVLAAGQGTVGPVLRYVGLRLPETVSLVIPIAALVAGLLAFAELARSRELTVIFAAGMSRLQLALAALPVALLIAGLQFAVEDRAVPYATAELRQWGIGDYKPEESDAFAWIRLGNDVVRYRRLPPGAATRLAQVTIYRRDAAGALTEAIEADTAVYDPAKGWTLHDVRRATGARLAAQELDRLPWPRGPDPSLLAEANTPPATRPLADLAAGLARDGLGDYPPYVYRLALYERLMRPVMTMLFVLLAVALARPLSRRAGLGIFVAAGAALGLLAWTAGEFLASLGGLGLLPPAIAAGAPPAILAFVAAFAALQGGSVAFRGRRRAAGGARRCSAPR